MEEKLTPYTPIRFVEYFQKLFDVVDSRQRRRSVNDVDHVEARFVIRGLEELRPRIYQQVVNHYGLTGKPKDEIEKLFETDYFTSFKKDFPDQYTNYHNLMIRMLKQGIEQIFTRHKDESGTYAIHSKHWKMFIIITWRRDRDPAKDEGLNHGFGQTSLNTRTSKFLKKGDVEIMVESQGLRKYSYASIETGLEKECATLSCFIDSHKVRYTYEVIDVE